MHMKDKAMILAPHQDDEIIACAGTINLLKELGLEVFIVFATNGDSGGREGASIRLKESTTVLKRLGISEKNIIILGFADTGMDYDNIFLWNLYHSPESKKHGTPRPIYPSVLCEIPLRGVSEEADLLFQCQEPCQIHYKESLSPPVFPMPEPV